MAQVFMQTLEKVRNLFFIVASSIRESEENFDYDLHSSEKLRYFDFTTHLQSTCDDKFLSSVLFWFQQRRSVYFRVYMYHVIPKF